MGDLPWRAKGGRLGCRRGWLRLAGLAAFVFVGYFALYGWLRVSGNIKIVKWTFVSEKHPEAYAAQLWDRPNQGTSVERFKNFRMAKQSWKGMAMWPAMKLEAGLDRRGWLPWNGIDEMVWNDTSTASHYLW